MLLILRFVGKSRSALEAFVVQLKAKPNSNPNKNRSFTVRSYETVQIYSLTNFGTDNQNTPKTRLSGVLQCSLNPKCFKERFAEPTKTHRHVLTSWKNRRKAVRGKERKNKRAETSSDYLGHWAAACTCARES